MGPQEGLTGTRDRRVEGLTTMGKDGVGGPLTQLGWKDQGPQGGSRDPGNGAWIPDADDSGIRDWWYHARYSGADER